MAESVLDLRAIEAKLQILERLAPGFSVPFSEDTAALLAHGRALRAALAPFIVNVGAKEGTPAIVREKGNAWFELAHPKWEDFERAAAVLAQATDGPT